MSSRIVSQKNLNSRAVGHLRIAGNQSVIASAAVEGMFSSMSLGGISVSSDMKEQLRSIFAQLGGSIDDEIASYTTGAFV